MAVESPALADDGVVQHMAHGKRILRQRRVEIGVFAEQDKADAVALPLGHEPLDHRLDHVGAADALVPLAEIERLHRSGQVDGQHQVMPLAFDIV